MTHLREIMLEELQRRNYSETTHDLTFAQSRILLGDSTARPTGWGPGRFANIKRRFQKRKLSAQTVRRAWLLCVSSTPRLSTGPGASLKHPTRKRRIASRRS